MGKKKPIFFQSGKRDGFAMYKTCEDTGGWRGGYYLFLQLGWVPFISPSSWKAL